MRYARILGGVGALALGIAVLVLSRRLPYHSDYGPGPGFLPTWIGAVLTGCAAVVTVQEVRAAPAGVFFGPRALVAVKVLAAIAATLLVVPVLGFAPAFAIFIAVAMRLTARHRWLACGCAAVVVGAGTHLVFVRWLSIPLPAGLLGG